jgi:ATP-binding cassette subfamily B protein
MLKLIKYLTPFITSILIIIIFLFVQAISDLSLPDYTSHIVNIGIQQEGIENAVPQVIRKQELNKIKLFLTGPERRTVARYYTFLDKKSLSKNGPNTLFY